MTQPTNWKRTLALTVGAAGVVHGLRRGGVRGLLEIAASVWAVKQSLVGLPLDGPSSSPERSVRDLSAERLRDDDLGVPGGAYNVRPEPIGDAVGMGPVPAQGMPRP